MNWLAGFSHRKKITLADTHVDGNLADVPTLLTFSDADLFGAGVDAMGEIRLAGSDGVTLLDFEVLNFSRSAPNVSARLWVKVPSILAEGGATGYLYYGNPHAPDAQNAPAVWSGYRAVWHLNETSGHFADATGNGHDTTAENVVDRGNTGKIYQCPEFDGTTGDYLSSPDSSDFAQNAGTVMAWVNQKERNTAADSYIFDHWIYPNGLLLAYDDRYPPNYFLQLRTSDGSTYSRAMDDGSHDLELDTWYLLSGTWDGDELALYRNDARIATDDQTETLGAPNTPARVGYKWEGLIEEVRVAKTALPAEEIKFLYHNMHETGGGWTFGDEEAAPYRFGVFQSPVFG